MMFSARLCVNIGCALIIALISGPLHAQFLGHNLPGDFGVGSGTQPDPGDFVSLLYMGYDGDALRNKDGDVLQYPGGGGDLDVNGYGIGWWHVTEKKIWGGNYSFMIWPAATDNRLEVPVLGQSQSTSTGLTDIYVQPINLGWHTDRADFTAGLGVFVPVGRYSAGADDNLGMGMWSGELFGGTTVYLDADKTWSFATTAFYEIHSKKEDTEVRVGNILTLEGGLGKSFMGGAANIGLAYYAQWKVTDDDLGGFVPPNELNFIGKNRAYGFGPELTLPIASKDKLWGTFNARYLRETGARSTVEGDMLMLTVTFLIPSVSLR